MIRTYMSDLLQYLTWRSTWPADQPAQLASARQPGGPVRPCPVRQSIQASSDHNVSASSRLWMESSLNQFTAFHRWMLCWQQSILAFIGRPPPSSIVSEWRQPERLTAHLPASRSYFTLSSSSVDTRTCTCTTSIESLLTLVAKVSPYCVPVSHAHDLMNIHIYPFFANSLTAPALSVTYSAAAAAAAACGALYKCYAFHLYLYT